jgi:lysophospholipase L1-like esterase
MTRTLLAVLGLVAWSTLAPSTYAAEPTPPSAADVQLRKEREAADALIPTTQAGTRYPKWEQQALARIAASKPLADHLEVIFDGDSITNGWTIQDHGLAVWKERIEPYHAYNFGISGDKTQHVLWRLAHGQAEGLHPKLIVLMIGTNNMGRSWSPAQVADGVEAIVTTYHQRCPEAAILLQGILPRGDAHDAIRGKISETNVLLAAWAPANGAIFRDFGAKFLEADGRLKADCFIDKTHPNAKGYGIWADAIKDILDQETGRTAKAP